MLIKTITETRFNTVNNISSFKEHSLDQFLNLNIKIKGEMLKWQIRQ